MSRSKKQRQGPYGADTGQLRRSKAAIVRREHSQAKPVKSQPQDRAQTKARQISPKIPFCRGDTVLLLGEGRLIDAISERCLGALDAEHDW